MQLNAAVIEVAVPASAILIGAMDCSFVPKSGKQTYGLDWFYNGSANRTQKGLEISVIAVVNVTNHRAYSLSVQQTPANSSERRSQSCRPSVDRQTIEQVRQMLKQLPHKPQASRGNGNAGSEGSRIDGSLEQLKMTRPYLPVSIQYWAVDSFYAKKKFVDKVVGLDLALISKLRTDANMRYLYTGAQKPRGARRKYDGKVNLTDVARWTSVKQLEPQLTQPLLERFIHQLDLNPTLIKSRPNYQNLLSYGIIGS